MTNDIPQQPQGGPRGPFDDDAPTEVAPSAYSAPEGYESATQTAGPGYAQQNAQWAGYPSAGQQAPPQGYPTGQQQHYQTAPYGSQPQYGSYPQYGATPQPAPAKRSSAVGWLIGAVLALAAIAAFGIVWFFMPKSSDSNSTSKATAAPSVAQPGSASPSATSSATPTPSDSTAAFPISSPGYCLNSQMVRQPVTQSDVRVATDSSPTCDYLTQIESLVLAKTDNIPDIKEFSINPFSASLGVHVPLNCHRDGHISHCVGGKHVDVYVQDASN